MHRLSHSYPDGFCVPSLAIRGFLGALDDEVLYEPASEDLDPLLEVVPCAAKVLLQPLSLR